MYEIRQTNIYIPSFLSSLNKFINIAILLLLVAFTSPNKEKVLIIGGGPSGLVAAKSALECGLEPIVLEQSNMLGGAWRPQAGLMWNSMLTNSSRYTTVFSDFPWQAGAAVFPNQREVYNYLVAYANTFELMQYIRFNSQVKLVRRAEDKWQVIWHEAGKTQQQYFKYVVVASGMFSKPYFPIIEGGKDFKGKMMHSKDYKSPEEFEGKRVVIVGGAFSGSQIAEDICKSASHVLNVISRPMYILQRYVEVRSDGYKLPIDFTFYNRQEHLNELMLTVQEKNEKAHQLYSKLCHNQANICKLLAVDPHAGTSPYITICNNYLEDIQAGRIEITLNRIVKLDKDGIIFNNGEKRLADIIIFCTGYQLDLPFLDKPIQEALSFMPEDRFQPVLLYKNVFHPQLPNMAFIGIYRGTYWGVMELQARWVTMVFAGMLPLPAIKEMLEGIKKELLIRTQKPRAQFPYDNYAEMMEDLAKEIGAVPNMELLKINDPRLYHIMLKTPIIPAHYRLEGFGKRFGVAKQMIEELYQFIQDTNQATDVAADHGSLES